MIPTVKPLSRGSSRHSILTSTTHDAVHNKGQVQTEQHARHPRKTSFNLSQQKQEAGLSQAVQSAIGSAGPPEQHQQLQQQQQSQRLAFESQEQAGMSEQPVFEQHQQGQHSDQSQVPVNTEAPEGATAQIGEKLQLEQRSPAALPGDSAGKYVQKRTKPMRLVHDWVGAGSKKQPHKL